LKKNARKKGEVTEENTGNWWEWGHKVTQPKAAPVWVKEGGWKGPNNSADTGEEKKGREGGPKKRTGGKGTKLNKAKRVYGGTFSGEGEKNTRGWGGKAKRTL